MAGTNGRNLQIKWDSVTLVGVKSKGYTLTNDLVDVTTDDDSGWRTLLATPGLRSVDITVGGISSDQVLINAFFNGISKTIVTELPTTTGTLTGTFLLSSFEQTGEHDGAVEFTAEFMSSGAVTYVAGV